MPLVWPGSIPIFFRKEMVLEKDGVLLALGRLSSMLTVRLGFGFRLTFDINKKERGKKRKKRKMKNPELTKKTTFL